MHTLTAPELDQFDSDLTTMAASAADDHDHKTAAVLLLVSQKLRDLRHHSELRAIRAKQSRRHLAIHGLTKSSNL